MTLNLTIITTKQEEQMKVSWNINCLRNNFKELTILAEEMDPTKVCLQETTVKLEQQTIFGGHEVFS
jgi:exonuclease III